jgi:hypothetical protein
VEFAGHLTHDATDTAAVVVLYKSTPQNVQARAPAVSLYLPAPHAVHVPPSGPVYPALHRHQLVATPAGDTAFARQASQTGKFQKWFSGHDMEMHEA